MLINNIQQCVYIIDVVPSSVTRDRVESVSLVEKRKTNTRETKCRNIQEIKTRRRLFVLTTIRGLELGDKLPPARYRHQNQNYLSRQMEMEAEKLKHEK